MMPRFDKATSDGDKRLEFYEARSAEGASRRWVYVDISYDNGDDIDVRLTYALDDVDIDEVIAWLQAYRSGGRGNG